MYLLHRLKPQIKDMRSTHLLVCPTCMDEDNPQLQLGRWPINDPQALRDPRPTGSTGGRFDTTNLYDFAEGSGAPSKPGMDWFWVHGNGLSGTLEWDSSSGNIVWSMIPTGETGTSRPYMSRDMNEAPDGGKSTNIDTSEYTRVRMLMKLNTRPGEGTWRGQVRWGTLVGSGWPYGGDRTAFIPSPDLNAMGDPWHLLTWDLSAVEAWTGTVTALYFNLFEYADSSDLARAVVEIKYITAEKQ